MKVTHEKPIITINNLLYLYIHLKTNEKLFIVKNVRVCVRACARTHIHTSCNIYTRQGTSKIIDKMIQVILHILFCIYFSIVPLSFLTVFKGSCYSLRLCPLLSKARSKRILILSNFMNSA